MLFRQQPITNNCQFWLFLNAIGRFFILILRRDVDHVTICGFALVSKVLQLFKEVSFKYFVILWRYQTVSAVMMLCSCRYSSVAWCLGLKMVLKLCACGIPALLHTVHTERAGLKLFSLSCRSKCRKVCAGLNTAESDLNRLSGTFQLGLIYDSVTMWCSFIKRLSVKDGGVK